MRRIGNHESTTYTDWPPEWARLPNLDTLEEISRGERVQQQVLFVEPVDDSRAGRLARVLAGVQGVQTADTKKGRNNCSYLMANVPGVVKGSEMEARVTVFDLLEAYADGPEDKAISHLLDTSLVDVGDRGHAREIRERLERLPEAAKWDDDIRIMDGGTRYWIMLDTKDLTTYHAIDKQRKTLEVSRKW